MREHLLGFIKAVQAATTGEPEGGGRQAIAIGPPAVENGLTLWCGYGYFSPKNVFVFGGGENPNPGEMTPEAGVDLFMKTYYPGIAPG